MYLTTHFTLAEMTTSQTAARLGLDNTPGPDGEANLRRVAEVLEQIRAIVGGPIVISSGYRAPAVNAAVGGSSTSAHMKGLAADTNRPGLTPRQFAEKIVPHMAELGIDQLILEFDSWVHIGLSNGPPRHEVLTINSGTGGYVSGLH
jgi:zinc D-Ala-D-Ala carboxypeptidase